jgi:hypothetical protein
MPSKAKQKDAKAKAYLAEKYPDLMHEVSTGSGRSEEEAQADAAAFTALLTAENGPEE